MTAETTDETRGPADRCACGDLYWRHGNGSDGGPCQVHTPVDANKVVTGGSPYSGQVFVRCDCAGFELAEDDL